MGDISNPSTPQLIAASGTYTGNNTANRAIPHGLGRTPRMVKIYRPSSAVAWNWYDILFPIGAFIFSTKITATSAFTADRLAVTIPDGTNFYVGNAGGYEASANMGTHVYFWVAW